MRAIPAGAATQPLIGIVADRGEPPHGVRKVPHRRRDEDPVPVDERRRPPVPEHGVARRSVPVAHDLTCRNGLGAFAEARAGSEPCHAVVTGPQQFPDRRQLAPRNGTSSPSSPRTVTHSSPAGAGGTPATSEVVTVVDKAVHSSAVGIEVWPETARVALIGPSTRFRVVPEQRVRNEIRCLEGSRGPRICEQRNVSKISHSTKRIARRAPLIRPVLKPVLEHVARTWCGRASKGGACGTEMCQDAAADAMYLPRGR